MTTYDRDVVMDELRDAQDPPSVLHALETIEQLLHARATSSRTAANFMGGAATPMEVADAFTQAIEAANAHQIVLSTIHNVLEGNL